MDMLSYIMGAKSGGGGGGGTYLPVMYITFDGEHVCNKTWQEIHDAIAAGTMVVSVITPTENMTEFLIAAYTDIDQGDYAVVFYGDGGLQLGAYAESADGYPVIS